MSKITVTTIAGATSGSDANKVKIESGDDLVVESGGIGIGTSTVSTAIGGGIEIHRANGSSFRIEDTTNSVVGELQVYSNGVNLVAQTNHPIIVSPNKAEIARFTTAGLHLGGTGAANALDDYEEGTFTPVVSGSSSAGTGTFSTQSGVYTKVGNRVFGSCFIAHSNTHNGSGAYQVSLPFVSTSNAGGAIVSYKFGWLNNGPDFADVAGGQAQMYVRYDGNTNVVDIPFGNTQNTAQMRLVFSFETAS